VVRAIVAFVACLCGCGFEHGQVIDAGRPEDTKGSDAGDGSVGLVCPESYAVTLPGSTSKYRPIVSNDNFWMHDDACNKDAPGDTHLAVIDSTAELAALTTVLEGSVTQPTNSWYLVGCVQAPGQSTPTAMWNWFSGATVPINTNIWGIYNSAQQPNDGDGIEDDVENLCILQSSQGKLLDGTGRNALGYGAVCECDGIATDPTVRARIPAM